MTSSEKTLKPTEMSFARKSFESVTKFAGRFEILGVLSRWWVENKAVIHALVVHGARVVQDDFDVCAEHLYDCSFSQARFCVKYPAFFCNSTTMIFAGFFFAIRL